ncbi:uncharacterized protein LOC125676081 isoform X2 [Ostrea edulis]|uniref:uncharacterized protein LOC125676081 isoform X2 n=1 Tax=Ostrea edulis TaxID=37623 RepID=UPI0024AF756B|nr:uncharacterized protein LOC125676081 isoform X2 [Ostrea edulis]
MISRKCVVLYFIVFSLCIQGNDTCNQTGPNGQCCEHYRWNNTTRECTPCPQGYTRDTCDAKCPYPTYGVACQGVCACQRLLCNAVTGCTVITGTTMETQTIYKRLSTVDYKRDIRNTVTAGNEVDMVLTAGVTSRHMMLIPPRHLIPLLVYPGVRVCPTLDFVFLVGTMVDQAEKHIDLRG